MKSEDVMRHLQSNTKLNFARQIFSSYSAKIEQSSQQRESLSPIEMRRMEFEAIERITGVFGISYDALMEAHPAS